MVNDDISDITEIALATDAVRMIVTPQVRSTVNPLLHGLLLSCCCCSLRKEVPITVILRRSGSICPHMISLKMSEKLFGRLQHWVKRLISNLL